MEYKSFAFDTKVEDEEKGIISGYGSVFGVKDLGGDIILKGAFSNSLKSGKSVKMLWQHDPSQPIGVWTDAKEDDRGLQLKGQLLLDIPQAKVAHTLLKHKALEGLSIGYKTIDYEITGKGDERARELKELELWETSLVTFPMNPEAGVTDVKQHINSPREVEQLLRKQGVPGTFAKLVALYGYDEAVSRLKGHREGDDESKATFIETINKLKEAINA